MFEELNKKINVENLQKIKKQHGKVRYSIEQKNKQPYPSNSLKRIDDQSLDDLQVAMQQRQQNFRKIFEQQHQDNFLKKNNSTPPNLLRKLQNEIQLLKSKLQIEQKTYYKQHQYKIQIYKRKQQWMQIQMSKLKFINEKYKSQELITKQLKKDINKYQEIKESLLRKIQDLDNENSSLKMRVNILEKQKINKNDEEGQQIHKQGNQLEKTNKLVTKIKQLQQDLQYQQKQNDQKKRHITKLLSQMEAYKEKLSNKQIEFDEIIRQKQQVFTRKQQNLNLEITYLKKRTKNLQETFIEKMNQITKLQAQLFSNISMTNHQYMSANIKQSRGAVQSSINLQDQSPIKAGPQLNNFTERKYIIPNKRQLGSHFNNPENLIKKQNVQNVNEKCVAQYQCECCYRKIHRYKLKLAEANNQILNLLNQKMECARKSQDTSKNISYLSREKQFRRGNLVNISYQIS